MVADSAKEATHPFQQFVTDKMRQQVFEQLQHTFPYYIYTTSCTETETEPCGGRREQTTATDVMLARPDLIVVKAQEVYLPTADSIWWSKRSGQDPSQCASS